ncbi:MAG: hypothetical protein ACU0B1_09145 [Thermohalobaculum sp.]|jgi:hypothetical protein
MFEPYSSVLPGITDTGIPRFVVADIICPAADKAPRHLITLESCGIVAATARDTLFVPLRAWPLPGK